MGHTEKNATTCDSVNQKKNIFLISSGINNPYGIYSIDQKLHQLMESIASVKRFHQKPVDIMVIDGSPEVLNHNQIATIQSQANWVICCGSTIKDTTDDHPGQLRIKTIGEQAIWQTFFQNLNADQEIYHRVFKLSGRYQLNDNFDLHQHQDDCVVTLRPEQWRYSPKQPDRISMALPTRLYSFPWQGMRDMHAVWQYITESNAANVRETHEIHMTECIFFDALQHFGIPVKPLQVIGVQGYYGQSGNFVYE